MSSLSFGTDIYAALQSSSLARHRRIHTGKRPYRCQEPTCDRRYGHSVKTHSTCFRTDLPSSFCRKTTLTKHQHRSHQTDVPSTPSSIRSQDFQPPALSPMPQPQQIQMKQEISEPNLTPYQAPMAIPQSYPPQPQLPPQIQQHMQQQQFPPSNQQQLQHVIQCISSHPEPVPISHTETTYVGCGLVMPPQHERFEAYIPRDTIPQTDTKYIPTAAIQGPNYMSMYQVPYQPDISQEFKQEFKPMQSRIFDPYQSRGAWGFLGSEG